MPDRTHPLLTVTAEQLPPGRPHRVPADVTVEPAPLPATDPVCRGSWAVGNACGICPKCRKEVEYLIANRAHERARAVSYVERAAAMANEDGQPTYASMLRVLARLIRED